jgi:hypothetical protein
MCEIAHCLSEAQASRRPSETETSSQYLQSIALIELPIIATLFPAGRRRSALGLASIFGFEAVSLLPLWVLMEFQRAETS